MVISQGETWRGQVVAPVAEHGESKSLPQSCCIKHCSLCMALREWSIVPHAGRCESKTLPLWPAIERVKHSPWSSVLREQGMPCGKALSERSITQGVASMARYWPNKQSIASVAGHWESEAFPGAGCWESRALPLWSFVERVKHCYHGSGSSLWRALWLGGIASMAGCWEQSCASVRALGERYIAPVAGGLESSALTCGRVLRKRSIDPMAGHWEGTKQAPIVERWERVKHCTYERGKHCHSCEALREWNIAPVSEC